VYADIQRAVDHDYTVVFPVAAAVILVMLALMLRSLVAPWYPMASVGLGFGAALGASVLFFQNLRGEPGLVFLNPGTATGNEPVAGRRCTLSDSQQAGQVFHSF
jgi:RND superfamily putative drug exporter